MVTANSKVSQKRYAYNFARSTFVVPQSFSVAVELLLEKARKNSIASHSNRSERMDQFLTILEDKRLNVKAEGTAEYFYQRRNTLIEKIKVLCRLLGSNAKQDEEVETNGKAKDKYEARDIARNTEKAAVDTIRWLLLLWKERSDFSEHRQTVEAGRRTAKFAQRSIEEKLKEIVATRTAEYSSMVSATNFKSETQKGRKEMEMKLLDVDLKGCRDIRFSRMNDLQGERWKARKRCLDQFGKYDGRIGSLCAKKAALLARKGAVDQEYAAVREKIVAQRVLYERLKEESELNRKRAFLARLERFRRNRAATIIQRNWKLYRASARWRKRRGRK